MALTYNEFYRPPSQDTETKFSGPMPGLMSGYPPPSAYPVYSGGSQGVQTQGPGTNYLGLGLAGLGLGSKLWNGLDVFGTEIPGLSSMFGGGSLLDALGFGSAAAGGAAAAPGVTAGLGAFPTAAQAAAPYAGLGGAPTLSSLGLAALPIALPFAGQALFGDSAAQDREEEIRMGQEINRLVGSGADITQTMPSGANPATHYNNAAMFAPMAHAMATGQQPGYVPTDPGVVGQLQQQTGDLDKLRMMHEATFGLEFGPETTAAQVFQNYKQRGLLSDADIPLFANAGFNVG